MASNDAGADRRRLPADPAQVLRIARGYFLDDVSKVDLARRENLSRWQVARLLEEARRLGLVRISVGDPADVDDELARAVTDALALRRTIVVGRSQRLGLEPSLDTIGAALADFLSNTVQEGESIGFTWSRAIEAMAAHLVDLPPCDVVQLAGAITLTGDRLGSVEVIRQVARTSHGTAFPIYAPIVVDSDSTRRSLEAQPEIAACLARTAALDLAVVSVGTWSADGSALHELLPPTLVRELHDAGAVGEISGRVFGADGRLVSTALDRRVIGITAAVLRRVPHIVATSYGPHRARATIAAARAGYVHTLIIDEPLARAILQQR